MAKTKDLTETLEKVQEQLAALSERVQRLETSSNRAAAPPAPAPVEKPAAGKSVAAKPSPTDEDMIAISAALAAYMGVRVRIRRIRLLSSRAWAQQGRVNIQASHNLY